MKKDDEFYKDEPDDGSKSLIGAALLFSLVTVLLIVGAVLLAAGVAYLVYRRCRSFIK